MKWFKGLYKTQNGFEFEDSVIEKTTVYYVPCERIRSNAMRSRSDFNEDKLVALAYSIKRYGIIEPLCIRKTELGDSYDYEIITGERRLRAAKLLEMNAVPCIIYDVPATISAEMSLSENVSHVHLDYFEEAFALRRLADAYEGSCENLAARLYMSDAELSEKLELLDLDFSERQAVLRCNLCENDATKLSQISDKELRSFLIKGIENGNTKLDCVSAPTDLHEIPVRTAIPRDVSSVVYGIKKKVDFLNKRSRRADITVDDCKDCVEIRVKIRI